MRPRYVVDRIHSDFLMSSRLDEYQATLMSAVDHGYELISVERFWRLILGDSVARQQRYLILRHDVDTDPGTAAAMWAIERELGARGSYFFRLSTLHLGLIGSIVAGGGEVGYHYEELATLVKERGIWRGDDALASIPEAQALLCRNLERLRAMTDLPMRVAAAHGDFVNRRLRIPNWVLLIDRAVRRAAGVDLEAYDDRFMRHVTSRHVDAGHLGRWEPEHVSAAIDRGEPVMYLLVHPRQWRAAPTANLKDDLRRLTEEVRYDVALTRHKRHPRVSAAHHAAAGLSSAVDAPLVSGAPAARVLRELGQTDAARSEGVQEAELVVTVPVSYDVERRYALDVVLTEWLGFAYVLMPHARPEVKIQRRGDEAGRTLTVADVLFAVPQSMWLTEESMPTTPLRHVDLGRAHGLPPAETSDHPASLPILFGPVHHGDAAMRETSDGYAIEIDIFGSIFFLLARYEELARPALDDHDRFPAFASLALSEGFLERPLADEYTDLLWSGIHALWPDLSRRASPFRLRLTHDIDQPWSAKAIPTRAVARGAIADLARRHDPVLAARRSRSFLAARAGRVAKGDPFDTFDLLMATSERWGLRSTFYVQAARRGRPYDATYTLHDPAILRLLRRIHDRGHEVGLHGGYDSYRSAEKTQAELQALQDACRRAGFEQGQWGSRQHYLRFESPLTWKIQCMAGLAHDSTLGFADAIGFRAGTCREYPVYDLVDRRRLDLRERPLAVMDATMFGYMGLDVEEAMNRAVGLVQACRRHGGELVVCYHNSSLPRTRDRARYRGFVGRLVEASLP